jgi:hypothetical protein
MHLGPPYPGVGTTECHIATIDRRLCERYNDVDVMAGSSLKTRSASMASTAIATVTKMMESLPEPAQDQVVQHLREYLEELQDELRWDALFKKSQPQLAAAARQARDRKVPCQTDGL